MRNARRDTLWDLNQTRPRQFENGWCRCLKEAIRVKNSSSHVRDAIIRFKDSMRIILVWQKESPISFISMGS